MRRSLLAALCCTAAPAAALAAAPAPTPTLAPVVVTATRTERPAAEVAPSVTVITAAEIKASGARKLEEVLAGSLGLEVVSAGTPGSVASARIRGSKPEQVLVLLDGVRLNSVQNGQFNLADLPVPLASIERIEVLRGPGSALYGAGALGGVIQIFTKGAEAEPSMDASFAVGRFGARRVGLAGGWKPGPVGVRVAVADESSDGYRPNSDSEQLTLDGRLTLDLPGDFLLELSGRRLEKESGSPGMRIGGSPAARQEDHNSFGSIRIAGRAGLADLRVLGQVTRADNQYKDPNPLWPSDSRHVSKAVSGEAQADLKMGRQTVTLGLETARDFLDSTDLGRLDEGRWAGLAQYDLALGRRLSVTLGARYDAHSEFKDEWSPRANLSVRVAEPLRLRAALGRSYRAPTLNDRYWPTEAWGWMGNPDLDPETAWEYELGASLAVGSRLQVEMTGFRRDAEDLIAPGVSPTNPVFGSMVNVKRARTWGSEASIGVRVCRAVNAGASYTWLHPEDRSTGKFLPAAVRHQLSGYLLLEPLPETKLRLDGRYARHYSDADAPGGVGSRQDLSYTVFDLTLTRPVYLGDVLALDLTLGVKNLFDRDYEVNPGYPMPPREWHAGVTASF